MRWLGANLGVQRAWVPMCCSSSEERVWVSTTELVFPEGRGPSEAPPPARP